jgi:hypothetical protein
VHHGRGISVQPWLCHSGKIDAYLRGQLLDNQLELIERQVV